MTKSHSKKTKETNFSGRVRHPTCPWLLPMIASGCCCISHQRNFFLRRPNLNFVDLSFKVIKFNVYFHFALWMVIPWFSKINFYIFFLCHITNSERSSYYFTIVMLKIMWRQSCILYYEHASFDIYTLCKYGQMIDLWRSNWWSF